MRALVRTTASLLALVLGAQTLQAAEPAACKTVRLAEPGWNDLAFTSGGATVLFDALGYEARSDLLGLNVIYESLKNRVLDIFLGYWDPA